MPEQPSAQASAMGGTLRRPFTEQVAFFRGKLGNLVPTQFWDDLEREQHDTGFMVAGAQKADLLSDLAMAVDRTIAEGKSLDAFRKDFRAIVQRHGWHGWTGEDTKGGRAWRTRTIYRTNASTSYAAGRYAQLVEGNFAYWVYRHGGSKDPRHEHLHIFDGLCLPPDHPFWKIFYPPSDWGCSCYVVGAISLRAAKRLGGDPDKTLPDGWDAINPKTGVPNGAGRNWDYAPGASVAPIVTATAEKIRHWDHRIAKGFMEGVPDDMRDALARSYRSLPSVADDARRFAQRVLEPSDAQIQPVWTLGLLTGEQAATVRSLTTIEVKLFDFSIDPSSIRHVQKEHGNAKTEQSRGQRAVVAEDYAILPRLLNMAGPIEDAGKSWRTGLPQIRITRQIGDVVYVAVFAVRNNKRTLALESLVIRRMSGK